MEKSYTLSSLYSQLHSSANGLTSDEAHARLKQYGPNETTGPRRVSLVVRFLSSFANPLSLILLLAAVVNRILGDWPGAVIIITIVVLSAVLDFVQTTRSQNAAARLRSQVALTATVIRDGRDCELPRRELVPGDVIRLIAGDLVPADARLATRRPETEFERGTRRFGFFIMETVFCLVMFIVIISVAFRRDAFQSLLFALALAVGYRTVSIQEAYRIPDEKQLILAGYHAFVDPPLPEAGQIVQDLKDDGVQVKILTGDNEAVARHVCGDVGLRAERIVLGGVMDRLADTALSAMVSTMPLRCTPRT